jgi:MFS superfamily sulfate permease-like transporter
LVGSGFGLHYLATFLSRPILLGYLAGVSLVLIFDQIPKMLGLAAGGENVWKNIVAIVTNLSAIHIPTVILSCILLVVGVLMIRYLKSVPIAIVLLIGSTIASAALGFANMGIATVGPIPSGWPQITVPANFDWSTLYLLVWPAAAIALISYADSVAIARSVASKNREEVSSQTELKSIGVANLAVVPVGGMPISASVSRTLVNDTIGASSQWSQIFGAIIIAAAIWLLSPFLQYIPKAALAIIIILSAYKIFDLDELDAIWRGWHTEALLAIATLLGVAILGILPGIGLAIVLAIINLVRTHAFPHDATLGVTKDGLTFRDTSRPPKTYDTPGLIIYRFDAPLFFGNSDYFHDRVIHFINHSPHKVRWLLIDAEAISSIDSTGAKMLKSLIFELEDLGIIVATARVKGPIRDTLRRTGLGARLENRPRFASIGKAYGAYCERYGIDPVKDVIEAELLSPKKHQHKS